MFQVRRGIAILCVACIVLGACDDDGSGVNPSTVPSLSGTWSGTLGTPMSGTALRMTWQVTHTGNTLTGPVTLVKPINNIPATGTLEGTLTGNDLSLRFNVPAGGVPGFSTCSISGTGSANATSSVISGTLLLAFSICAGTGLEPPTSTQFTLTR